MPGVPSGRGCHACRKQKKKCDAGENGVPCTRCKRVKITCKGYGQLNYKFQDEGKKFLSRDKRVPKSDIEPTPGQVALTPHLHHTPMNSMTRLSSAFIGSLSLAIDIRYQLLGNFGPYLVEVPRRLGINPALDAASDALVAAHANLCSNGRFVPHYGLMHKYSKALSALRGVLNDHDKAQMSETLCAIMILMILQTLINPTQGVCASHSEGAVQILRSRGFRPPKDEFERQLLQTLRGPVVFEALSWDRFRLSREEWKILVGNRLEATNVDGGWFTCLADVPELLHRSREARDDARPLWDTDLQDLVTETQSLLDHCRVNVAELRQLFASLERSPLPAGIGNLLYVNRLRMLSLALMTSIFLSRIHISLLGEPSRFTTECVQWSEQIFDLAQIATQYHPLGSMAMFFPLNAAWIGTPSLNLREQIKDLILDYNMACLGHSSIEKTEADLEKVEKRFLLQAPATSQESCFS